VTWSETHAMGAVRLMEMFVRGNSEPKEFSRLIQEYAATIRMPARLSDRRVKGFVATGGNIDSIVRICRGNRGPSAEPQTVSVEELPIGEFTAFDGNFTAKLPTLFPSMVAPCAWQASSTIRNFLLLATSR
jgi:hypothetical protein